MSFFKEGDVVICVDGIIGKLTINNVYTILPKYVGDNINMVWILNDRGEVDYYMSKRFIPIRYYRNKIIDEILK